MLRYDYYNAEDDDRISYGDLPRDSFFETYFETYKEGFIIGTLLMLGKM